MENVGSEIMTGNELEVAAALVSLAHSSLLQHKNHHHVDDDKMTMQQDDDDAAAIVRVAKLKGKEEKLTDERKNMSVPRNCCAQKQQQQQQIYWRTSYYNKMLAGVGGKSRKPLTESEKEARRMSRVLANRESARRTLRRRQAMFDELTRKVSDLTIENEELKREKDLAATEYHSLKTTNNSFKKQMSQMITEAWQIQQVENPMPGEHHASPSTHAPSFSYGAPSSLSLGCHYKTQPIEATVLQCKSENDDARRPNLFTDGRNSNTSIPSSGALYVLPLSTAFPHSFNPTDSDSFNPTDVKRDINTVSSCQSPLHLNVRGEYYSSSGTMHTDHHHHAGFGISPDKRHKSETNPRMILMPTPISCVRPVSSSREGGRQLNFVTSQQEGFIEIPVTGYAVNIVSEENPEPAAAEARRRRRELMKVRGN